MRVPAGVLRPAVSALIAFLAAVTLAHAMTLSDPNWAVTQHRQARRRRRPGPPGWPIAGESGRRGATMSC
jgi:hypothetical protein